MTRSCAKQRNGQRPLAGAQGTLARVGGDEFMLLRAHRAGTQQRRVAGYQGCASSSSPFSVAARFTG